MGVRTIIAVRESPSLCKLYYNHWLEPNHIAEVLVHALNEQHYACAEDLATYLEETEPKFQFEDRHTFCHPDNVRYIYPWVQADLEYVFEITLTSSPTIELFKVRHEWGDETASTFAYSIYWSYTDWRFYDQEKLERAVETGNVVEHFYTAEHSDKRGHAAMFQDSSELHDLTGELSRMGL